MAASAAGSPSVAAIATMVPVTAAGSSPLSRRSTGASHRAISSRAVSARAVPEQYRSQQPALAARARSTAGDDRQVTELRRDTVRAAVDLAVDDEPGADARCPAR